MDQNHIRPVPLTPRNHDLTDIMNHDLPRLQIQMLLFKLILLLDGGTDNNFKDKIL